MKEVVIIGAGPAGLACAVELLDVHGIKAKIIDPLPSVGGIARSETLGDNIMDLGGHRFFSRSPRILEWWSKFLPIEPLKEGSEREQVLISYHGSSQALGESLHFADTYEQASFLLRPRSSKILFQGKFYDYPISLNVHTIRNLGLVTTIKIFFDYIKATINPIRPEVSLSDFFKNRFGNKLYSLFFKDYTEKVWRFSCDSISADWGKQRIKGLDISKILLNSLKRLSPLSSNDSVPETSLIEWFLYPKYGCGQMWDEVSKYLIENGVEIRLGQKVETIFHDNSLVTHMNVVDLDSQSSYSLPCDLCYSTMPLGSLITSLDPSAPKSCLDIVEGLVSKDFLTVGILLDEQHLKSKDSILLDKEGLIKENWIYINESNVKVGRIQLFNNWSPYMVPDKSKVFLGVEYFVDEGDDLWESSDEQIVTFVMKELISLGFVSDAYYDDAHVVRVKNAYPAYVDTYSKINTVKEFLDQFKNLVPLGRGGLHRYNNQDHSMLTAFKAVENLSQNLHPAEGVWAVNEEKEYLESK